ncbi:helix-turn-helix domain-containing protein [Kitasatospora sp. NPDC059795]|uniref:helix-turn-helix domain-containing protein n=1 Tax=Kitasatospora sp. NPDC059795 TaxID=3346949 RepID=UPI00364E8C6A
MPGGRTRATAPRDYSDDVENWPNATVADGPAAALQEVARRLAAALESRPDVSQRTLATSSGVGRATIQEVIAGTRWPDLRTLYRLERALDTSLWPGGNATVSEQVRPSYDYLRPAA